MPHPVLRYEVNKKLFFFKLLNRKGYLYRQPHNPTVKYKIKFRTFKEDKS